MKVEVAVLGSPFLNFVSQFGLAGRQRASVQIRFISTFSSKIVTLSCDFVPHN